MTTGF